jgi:hypothetical protein
MTAHQIAHRWEQPAELGRPASDSQGVSLR